MRKLSCILFLSISCISAQEVSVETALKTMEVDVAALRVQRDKVRAEIPAPSRVEVIPYTITIPLPGILTWPNRFGGLESGNLTLTLRHYDGITIAEPVEGGGWKGRRFLVQADGLTVKPPLLKGEVRIHIGDNIDDWVVLTVDATIKEGQISGAWSTTLKGTPPATARSGVLQGANIREESSSFQTLVKPAEDISLSAHSFYTSAQYLDRSAAQLYREIRACVIAKETKISLAHASKLTWVEDVKYPELPAHERKSKTDRPKIPSDDPLLGDLGSDLGNSRLDAKKTGKKDDTSNVRGLKDFVASIQTRISQRRSLVEAIAKNPNTKPQIGSQDSGDPQFGPWYGEELLPTQKGGGNFFPKDAGSAGKTRWMEVGDWKAYGPFVQISRQFETSQLPEFIPGPDLQFAVDPRLASRGKNSTAPKEFLPGSCDIETGSGYVRPPQWASFQDHGTNRWDYPNSTIYASSTLQCETERELWVGVVVNDHGKLWVNDRLVWVSPRDTDPRRMEETYVFPVRFSAGTNRLVFRCDNDLGPTWFSVRLCVQGGPRPTGEASSVLATSKERQSKAGSPVAGTNGWRGDGSGRWPDARPPLAWDSERGINVAWRKVLGLSYATPVIVGAQVFTFEEPDTLVCLDKMNGKELWRRSLSIAQIRSPELAAEAEKILARVKTVQEILEKLGVNKGERRAALEKTGLSTVQADAKLKELDSGSNEYLDFIGKKCGVPHVGWYNDTGHTYATPVSDGKALYVKLNTGVLAKVENDGKVLWQVDHGCSAKDSSCTPSPLLVGSKVLVFGPIADGKAQAKTSKDVEDEEKIVVPEDPDYKTKANQIRAFDAATGALAWSTPTWGPGMVCGTPVAMRLSNATESLDVVVTANGAVIRVEDGKVLRSYLGSQEHYGSPITDGQGTVIISGQADKAAYELILVDRNNIGVKTRWFVSHFGVFQDGNYGLIHQGKLWFSRPLVDVTDLATGRLEWLSGNVFYTRPGRGYPPCVLAGDTLYVADNAQWFQPTYRPNLVPFPGALTTIDANTPGLILAKNRIEQVHGGFSCDGDRLYVRGRTSLMCYAYTGDAGRAWEAATVASEILSVGYPDCPADGKTIAPEKIIEMPKTRVSIGSSADGPISNWLFAGPLASGSEEAQAQILSDPSLSIWYSGAKIEVPSLSVPVRTLSGDNMPEWASPDWFRIYGRENYKRGPHIGYSEMFGKHIEISRLIKPESGKVILLATLLTSDQARLLRFDAGHKQVLKAWIGGTPIQHNQCVQFPAGAVPLVIAVRIDDPGEALILQPRFWPSAGTSQDQSEWKKFMQRAKPWLEKAAKLAPETPAGKKAQSILATM